MVKKDAASKRLAKEIARAKAAARFKTKVRELTRRTPLFPPEELPVLLQLEGPGPALDPILAAFNAFDLDHRSLSDWRSLVFHLAHVLFPTPRPPGAPREWTDERLCRLLADVAAYKRENPKASDTAICNWLKRNWPKHSPGRLRRVLQDARNPARNDLLWRTAYGFLTQQMLREAAAACGVTEDVSWTEAVEKNVLSKAMQAAVRKAIEEADKLWGH